MTQGRESSQEWVCTRRLLTTVGTSSSEDWKQQRTELSCKRGEGAREFLSQLPSVTALGLAHERTVACTLAERALQALAARCRQLEECLQRIPAEEM